MKEVVLYMIHAVNIAVNDIKNIRANAIHLHTIGKRMPNNEIALKDAKSHTTGPGCFDIGSEAELKTGAKPYSQARQKHRKEHGYGQATINSEVSGSGHTNDTPQ